MRADFNADWHRRALAEDSAAVSQFARAALGPLYRFCFYRVGGDRHLCEEVVQETLLIAIGQLDRYDPERAAGNILGWLMGLARNEIRRTLAVRQAKSLEALWERMDDDLMRVLHDGSRSAEPPTRDGTSSAAVWITLPERPRVALAWVPAAATS